MRLPFPLGELEQGQRAFDVDMVRRDGRELRARGQERRKVKDPVDLELRHHAFEQPAIGDRSEELAAHEASERRVERVDVERHDGGIGGGEARDERVSDLSSRAGDQDDGFAHVK